MRFARIALIAAAAAGIAYISLRAEQPPPIAGLWTRWPDAHGDQALVRFYFFHPEGIGLYRYGKLGLNTTHSFDWRVDGDELELRFRKTGEVRRTRFRLENGGLVLLDDPKEPFEKTVRYAFVPPPLAAPDVFADVPGRLWLDQKKFATGGLGFNLYQLRDAGIDGRGVGWFHIGDFDDWTTEALWYRWDARKETLELSFPVRGDSAITKVTRAGDELTLVDDPRGFWHFRTYKDAGPSFGALLKM
jgi:hypothetical protein